MNTNPYKRNDRFQNNPKNGGYNHLNPNAPGSSGMMKPKGDKLDDSDKPKRKIQIDKYNVSSHSIFIDFVSQFTVQRRLK